MKRRDVPILPRLSDMSLENLTIDVMKLETIEGLKVNLPLNWILTQQVLAQFPRAIVTAQGVKHEG